MWVILRLIWAVTFMAPPLFMEPAGITGRGGEHIITRVPGPGAGASTTIPGMAGVLAGIINGISAGMFRTVTAGMEATGALPCIAHLVTLMVGTAAITDTGPAGHPTDRDRPHIPVL